MSTTIVWFRRNLRLCDNHALRAACDSGEPVLPVYVCDELDSGGASRWWLHHSLERLDQALAKLGSQLVVRQGDPVDALRELVAETGATRICYAQRCEPAARDQERRLHGALPDSVQVNAFDDQRLQPFATVLTGSGLPYKVFTPFWKASVALGEPDLPLPAPTELRAFSGSVSTLPVKALQLLPSKPDWAGGLRDTWEPGEESALQALDRAADVAADYAVTRDRPDMDMTTRLSPHLHFGELSPRQVWHTINATGRGEALLRQLYWREFSYYLLQHYPDLPSRPLRKEFEFFPWVEDETALHAWQRGMTGYPIVDAGMRQLWHTGWMHNRVRMIAASFLVKDLMIPWQRGAEWFMDTLVDADLANNSASWQWVAGCGTDAAPYFRIFNPTTQAQKFDPDGEYVRRWIPELADGSAAYPEPIVDHGVARKEALAAYQSSRDLLKSGAGLSP